MSHRLKKNGPNSYLGNETVAVQTSKMAGKSSISLREKEGGGA
jgi:hypothetical protein